MEMLEQAAHTLQRVGLAVILLFFAGDVVAGDPCRSGLEPGQRPGPYSFVLCTGPGRGKSSCYICDTAARPAVIVFARTPNDAVGKLAAGIDKAVTEHKAAELRA